MASSGPVPVTIFSNDGVKKTTCKKARSCNTHKFITRVDGQGQYMRFAFFASSLEEGNSILAELHNKKIIDGVFTHAYSRTKNVQSGYSIHGIAHIISRDYDFNFMRKQIPRASLRVSFYPEGTYPRKNTTETVQVIQEGNQLDGQTNNCSFNGSTNSYTEYSNEASFPSFN